MILTIEVTTIILSVVALIVTIIGFFASLKFYTDGEDRGKDRINAREIWGYFR